MDACKPIRFYSTAETAAQALAVVSLFAGILAALVFLS